MATFLFRNLGLKFLSVCIAVLLWLAVAGERVVERVMRAPVEFQNLPAGLELVGVPPETVEVRVRGSSGALSRIQPGDMSTVVDLRGARSGRRLFPLTPGQVAVPYGVDVVQVSPSTLIAELETSGARAIPIEPVVEGRPAAGFEVTRVSIDPATVAAAGPMSVLNRLKAATTEPVSVANATQTIRATVTIGVGEANVRLHAPLTAEVTVTIAPVKPR